MKITYLLKSMWKSVCWYSRRVIFNLLWRSVVTIPRNEDGLLDSKNISRIYIVCDHNGDPIFIVAITAHGPAIEPFTPKLLKEVENSGISFERSSIQDYVYYYHLGESMQDLRKKMKIKVS